MTWRQFAFYYNLAKVKKKKMMDGGIKWALRKNVHDTCCIDITTMVADKEEEG